MNKNENKPFFFLSQYIRFIDFNSKDYIKTEEIIFPSSETQRYVAKST